MRVKLSDGQIATAEKTHRGWVVQHLEDWSVWPALREAGDLVVVDWGNASNYGSITIALDGAAAEAAEKERMLRGKS